jgi:hypothetical protein
MVRRPFDLKRRERTKSKNWKEKTVSWGITSEVVASQNWAAGGGFK